MTIDRITPVSLGSSLLHSFEALVSTYSASLAVVQQPCGLARPAGSSCFAGRAHELSVFSPDRCTIMNPISIFMLGMAMSTDAFAAALGKGAGMFKPRFGQALKIGFIFGFVETLTPVAGWLLGAAAAPYIESIDHWLAFALLGGLGCHMIYGTFRDDSENSKEACANGGIFSIALTGLATSIDALAVGVGLAFIDVNIVLVAVVIGLCTWTMVTIGIMMGRIFGKIVGKRAEMFGGIVLIIVGASILYEHLSASGSI